ncbi:MAG: arginase family protein [Methanobacterium sp.]|nr:arginase family protein [Methanobacterium sp.]
MLDKDVFPVVFGGDHTITAPLVEAYDEPIDIVHFDTHLDFVDGTEDMKYSHSNPIKRISELENVNNITQIGIRGFTGYKSNYEEALNYGSNIITAADVIKNGTSWVLNQIPKSDNIYVKFDIDVIDPSIAPGTGTPEPGGLNYIQMKNLITQLHLKGEIKGINIVEVNPLFDVAETTFLLASRIVFDFLGSIF